MLVPTFGNLVPFLTRRHLALDSRCFGCETHSWTSAGMQQCKKRKILAFGTFFDFILDPCVNTKNYAMPWCWMLLSLAGQKSYCTAPHAVALWNFSDTSASKAFSGSLEEGPYIRKSESHVKTSETDFQVCISRRLGLFGKESSFLRHCHNCTL